MYCAGSRKLILLGTIWCGATISTFVSWRSVGLVVGMPNSSLFLFSVSVSWRRARGLPCKRSSIRSLQASGNSGRRATGVAKPGIALTSVRSRPVTPDGDQGEKGCGTVNTAGQQYKCAVRPIVKRHAAGQCELSQGECLQPDFRSKNLTGQVGLREMTGWAGGIAGGSIRTNSKKDPRSTTASEQSSKPGWEEVLPRW